MSKKRANGEGNFRKRPNGTWEGRIVIDDKRYSLYGKTRTEVKKKIEALITTHNSGTDLELKDMTVEQWLDVWLKKYKLKAKDSTRTVYAFDIKKHILPYIGSIKLVSLKSETIQDMYDHLEKEIKLSPRGLNYTHCILNNALKKAAQLKTIIKDNPCSACVAPERPKTELKFISDDDIPRLIEAIKKDKYGNLMYVAMCTGMRESELLGLTWDCIDEKHNRIRIYRQLVNQRFKGGTYVFTTTKSKKERSFIAIPSVFDALSRAKQQQEEYKAQFGEAWSNPDGFVFTNETGKHLTSGGIWRRFKKIVEALGMREIRFHDLRHSFAQQSIKGGADVQTVSNILGHVSVAFTLDTYTHVDEQKQIMSAKCFENRMEDLLK